MIDYRKIWFVLRLGEKLYGDKKIINSLCENNGINEDKAYEKWPIDINTVSDLYYWLKIGEKECKESNRSESCSEGAHFKHVLKGMEPQERVLFVKALNRIREMRSFRSGNEAIKVMFEESELFSKDNPDSILVFRGTLQNYMVVGRCADLLYEKLGWQTAIAIYEDVSYCCMMLSSCAMAVIQNMMDIEISCLQLNFDYVSFEDEVCVTLALQQMMIDYARLKVEDHDIILPTLGFLDPGVIVDSDGIENEVRFPFYELKKDFFCLFTSKGMPHMVVSDHTWYISTSEYDLAGSVADMLSYTLKWYEDKKYEIGFDTRAFGLLCLKDFYEKKEKYPERILIMDFNGIYTSYDEDAEWLANEYSLPLWDRYFDDDFSKPMVMMSEQMASHILERSPKVTLDGSLMQDTEDRMTLKPNRMNMGLLDMTEYQNVTVFKRKDGKYIIRATLNGKELQPQVLNESLEELYVNYEKNGLKKLVLKYILWDVYTLKNAKNKR